MSTIVLFGPVSLQLCLSPCMEDKQQLLHLVSASEPFTLSLGIQINPPNNTTLDIPEQAFQKDIQQPQPAPLTPGFQPYLGWGHHLKLAFAFWNRLFN